MYMHVKHMYMYMHIYMPPLKVTYIAHNIMHSIHQKGHLCKLLSSQA